MVITLFLILKTGTQNWTPYKFTQKENYGDASTHDQYFEVNFPTVNLNNVKLNFAIRSEKQLHTFWCGVFR